MSRRPILEQLAHVREQADTPAEQLAAVLHAYARISHRRPQDTEIAAFVHRGEHILHAQQHLRGLVRDVIAEAAQTGDVRDDVAPEELADYCLHALAAASSLPSEAAVNRLVDVTPAGLRPVR